MTQQLKGCPCGGKVKITEKRRGNYRREGSYFQGLCGRCHARGPLIQDSPDQAVQAWNEHVGGFNTSPQWIGVDERVPEERERAYQVIVVCVKTHGVDSMYPDKGVRRFQQDWVVRRWPQNFTHWMEAMPWPGESV